MDTNERLRAGDRCHNFFMKTIDDQVLESGDFKGKKVWLAFYRYAGCPVCATHLAQVIESRAFFESSGVSFVAVYDCKPENVPTWIRRNVSAVLRVVADGTQKLHEKFGTEKSLKKLLSLGSFVSRVTAATEGHFENSFDGSMTLMPAHFLIDENGLISHAHYADHAGDHIPWKVVREFATSREMIEAAPEEITQIDELVTSVTTLKPTAALAKGFAAIYKWKLKTGREADFIGVWSKLESEMLARYKDYQGARLHLDSDQHLVAYTRWATKSAWETFWITKEQTLPDYVTLGACIDKAFEPHVLRAVHDTLVTTGEVDEQDDEPTLVG